MPRSAAGHRRSTPPPSTSALRRLLQSSANSPLAEQRLPHPSPCRKDRRDLLNAGPRRSAPHLRANLVFGTDRPSPPIRPDEFPIGTTSADEFPVGTRGS